MTPDTARQMVAAKLFGQVELVRLAAVHLNANGSITLTSGSFQSPTLHSAMGAMANAGLEAFVQAAALEMERGLRLNAVSPGWIAETLVKLGRDATEGAPVSDVVDCYLQAIDGSFSGRVLQPAPRNRMQ
jgi:NAD(P)-dependent dehydrogenase (short-subunit alcohol dehydrogenase family)